jgi:hypothetical protein
MHKSALKSVSRDQHLIRTLWSTVLSVQTYATAETRFFCFHFVQGTQNGFEIYFKLFIQ